MGKFIIIGERIHCISPVIKKAMEEMDPEPILKRAKEQLDAGATYLDVNIGPAEVVFQSLCVAVICQYVSCLDAANEYAHIIHQIMVIIIEMRAGDAVYPFL